MLMQLSSHLYICICYVLAVLLLIPFTNIQWHWRLQCIQNTIVSSHSKGSDSLVSLMSMPMCLLHSYMSTFSKLSKPILLIHIC